jgi:H+/gluconate symporter-like permease
MKILFTVIIYCSGSGFFLSPNNHIFVTINNNFNLQSDEH